MDHKLKNIVSTESQRILSELRKNNQRDLFEDLFDQFYQIRDDIWKDDFSKEKENQIIKPFKLLIEHNQVTDSLIYLSLNSLKQIIPNIQILDSKLIHELIFSILNSKYSITSEFESNRVIHQILSFIQILIHHCSSNFLLDDTLKLLIDYFLLEINSLKGISSVPLLLIDSFTDFLYLIFNKNDQMILKLQKDLIISLFYISNNFQSNFDAVSCYVSLTLLLFISKFNLNNNFIYLISISSILLNQQINLCQSRDNFVLSLRLFFNVFQFKYIEYFLLFQKNFNNLLNFFNNSNINNTFKLYVLEIIFDFVSQKYFIQILFINTNNRKGFINLF